jgi:hypothetical protein
MSASVEPRPLHLYTIDTLCADLVSGRVVGVGIDNRALVLSDAKSRAVLNWYRTNRRKWAAGVREEDIEAIVDSALKATPPVLPATASNATGSSRRLRLTELRAHRFAGIHGYGTPNQPPEDLVFHPSPELTLLEGVNGSGKTSLINAVVWCLTGEIYRPQRAPENADREFNYHINQQLDAAPLAASFHDLTPITPLPDPRKFRPEQSEAIPLDTWVQLSFVDEDGQVFVVKRSQSRTPRRKVTSTVSGISELGVDPISLRVGTVMPGLIPHIQLDNASELGRAVSQLTGLADLVHLAKHAGRVKERATTELTKQRRVEIDAADNQFVVARKDLLARISEYPAMAPAGTPEKEVPLPSSDQSVEVNLARLTGHFETSKARALAEAGDTLGDSFDPSDPKARSDLERSVGAARAELTRLGSLKSAARLKGLGALSAAECAKALERIQTILTQASVFAELAANPPLARRKQLYARVAAWLMDEQQKSKLGTQPKIEVCPVCNGDIKDALDPISHRSVSEHLTDAMNSDAETLAQSLSAWTQSTLGMLARELPKALKAELDTELPAEPRDLIRIALTEELFSADCFSGSLRALKGASIELCDRHTTPLPPLTEPTPIAWPPRLSLSVGHLGEVLRRVSRAMAFGDWRRQNSSAIRTAFETIVGTDTEGATLAGKISALERVVTGAAPINAAIDLCGRMAAALSSRRKLEARIEAYSTTAKSLEPIILLSGLAEQQVVDLQRVLHGQTANWRAKIYQKTHTAAHDLVNIHVDSRGSVGIAVGSALASAPAQHVSNASALRASLVAFLLAFWEHVLAVHGGLKLLLLDDSQELLDIENRERLAAALPELVRAGGQLVATTFDREFARFVSTYGRQALSAGAVHRAVFPVVSVRPTLTLPLAIDSLEEKRRRFLNPENADVAEFAQDYVAEARVFIEARLASFFDDPAHSAPLSTPTLSDLLGRLRSKVNARASDFFCSLPVATFAQQPSLANGSVCLRLLNRSHHDKHLISFMDVEEIKDELRSLCAGTLELHEEFRRWCKREPLGSTQRTQISLSPITAPQFELDIHRDLAAFTGDTTASSGSGESEALSGQWFENRALFYIRCHNFGFAAPAGSIAVVETEPTDIEDQRLVIAYHDDLVLARRLVRSADDRTRIALVAQTPDPTKSPPSRVFSHAEVQLFRVVGMLLDAADVVPPRARTEAAQVSDAPSLQRIETAFRVRDTSALPLALPGQIVLGGAALRPADLATHEGRLAAVCLSDGSSIFKRIGAALPAPLPHIRLFESIGFGESVLVQTEPIEGSPTRYPLMLGARLVVGVLYND